MAMEIAMKTRNVLCDLKPADGASCVFEVSSRELKDTVVEALIVRWLNDNPAPSLPGRCAWCGKVEMPDAMLLPYGAEPGTHTWLHSECWPSWQAARRATALSAVSSERHEIREKVLERLATRPRSSLSASLTAKCELRQGLGTARRCF
jgi:hypothetical protein